jgi:hypothetical protein
MNLLARTVLLVNLAAAVPAFAADPDAYLRRFFGTYVGQAEEVTLDDQVRVERDVDLTISPKGKDGLLLTWTNVTLVKGRRDVPGVQRRTDEMWLVPAPGRGFYHARAAYDPFSERRPLDAIAGGDPVRWGTMSDNSLQVYSFVILDDGRYELQIYVRALTSDGLSLDWKRYMDGELVAHMTGTLVRTR